MMVLQKKPNEEPDEESNEESDEIDRSTLHSTLSGPPLPFFLMVHHLTLYSALLLFLPTGTKRIL